MRVLLSILFLFLATLSLQAQAGFTLSGKSLGTLKQMTKQDAWSKLFYTPSLHFSTPTKSPTTSTSSITTNPVPLAYAYKDLALFCKLEVKMEKVVKMPVKFRLGSVDYVDWLEGKRELY